MIRYFFFIMVLAGSVGAGAVQPDAGRETQPSGSSEADDSVGQAVKDLVEAATWDAMAILPEKWREALDSEQQSALIGELLKKAADLSPCTLADDGRVVVLWRVRAGQQSITRGDTSLLGQDVFVVGGRCVWAVAQLLDCQFPSSTMIRGNMTAGEANAALAAVAAATVARMRMPETAKVKLLSEERRQQIASDPDTADPVLLRLSTDSSVAVRAAVASNPKAPSRALWKMIMSDPDENVRTLAEKTLEYARSPLQEWREKQLKR